METPQYPITILRVGYGPNRSGTVTGGRCRDAYFTFPRLFLDENLDISRSWKKLR